MQRRDQRKDEPALASVSCRGNDGRTRLDVSRQNVCVITALIIHFLLFLHIFCLVPKEQYNFVTTAHSVTGTRPLSCELPAVSSCEIQVKRPRSFACQISMLYRGNFFLFELINSLCLPPVLKHVLTFVKMHNVIVILKHKWSPQCKKSITSILCFNFKGLLKIQLLKKK